MTRRARPRVSIGAALVLMVLLAPVLASVLAPHPPGLQDLARSQQPPAWVEGGSWENPLGTDHLGRDVLSRIPASPYLTSVRPPSFSDGLWGEEGGTCLHEA